MVIFNSYVKLPEDKHHFNHNVMVFRIKVMGCSPRVTPFFTAPCPLRGACQWGVCGWIASVGGKAFQCGANRATGNVLDFAVLRICPLNTKHQTKSEKTNKNKATKDATDGMKMCTKKNEVVVIWLKAEDIELPNNRANWIVAAASHHTIVNNQTQTSSSRLMSPHEWIWQCVETLYPCSSHQNSWYSWMFIPLKMVLIGIDPYPYGHCGNRHG